MDVSTNIPYELVAKIVSAADVPIDTFLAFVSIGAVPKRVAVTPYLQEKLREIHVRRTRLFKDKRVVLENIKYQINMDMTCHFHGVQQWAAISVDVGT